MFQPRDLGLFLGDAPVASVAARLHDEPTFDPACCTGSDAMTPLEPKLAPPEHRAGPSALGVTQLARGEDRDTSASTSKR